MTGRLVMMLLAVMFLSGAMLGLTSSGGIASQAYAQSAACTNYTSEYNVYGWSDFNCPPYGCTWSVGKYYTWSRATSDHTCPAGSTYRYMGVEATQCDTSVDETLVLEAWNGLTKVGSWEDTDGDGIVKSDCYASDNWPTTRLSYYKGSSPENEICIDEHRWFSGCCDCT